MNLSVIYLLLSLLTVSHSATVAPLKIGILYYSPVDKPLQQELAQEIQATYHCTVTVIGTGTGLPSAAYYKPRNRYRAPAILHYQDQLTGYDKILGITDKDISTTKNGVFDWGVMGLGSCPGKSCVVSTFRIRTTNKKLFNDRFIKVSLHELGHTIGLPHCGSDGTCFMQDAGGTVKQIDKESRTLCAHCKKLISPYTR